MDTVFGCGDLRDDLGYGVLWLKDIGTCYVDCRAPFDQFMNDLETDTAVAAGDDGDSAGEIRGGHFKRWEQAGECHCGHCYCYIAKVGKMRDIESKHNGELAKSNGDCSYEVFQ